MIESERLKNRSHPVTQVNPENQKRDDVPNDVTWLMENFDHEFMKIAHFHPAVGGRVHRPVLESDQVENDED